MDERPSLHSLPEAKREQARERFLLLKPFLEEGVPLTAVAQQHRIPLRTLRRWVQLYRTFGLPGLVRPDPIERGTRIMPPILKELIEGLALQVPAPSTAAVHRQVSDICQQKGWAAPSYSCVYDVVRKIDPALKTLAHDGEKQYRQKFDLIYRREASRLNEIWQADHCLLDIWVFDEQERPRRPWLTIILDDYSRAVSGYYLAFDSPSILRTALTLRQAIWRKGDSMWAIHGIPETFYTDHGSDFTSKHLEQVGADIKMQLVFSLPGIRWTPLSRQLFSFFKVHQVSPMAQPFGNTW